VVAPGARHRYHATVVEAQSYSEHLSRSPRNP
jgi:hypothetical protein